MRMLIALAVGLALTGCTTTRQIVTADMRSGLDALVGQPVEAAIARFGEPDGSLTTGELTIYDWRRSFTGTAVTTSDFYLVGSGHFSSITRTPVDLGCGVRLLTDENSLITGWHYEGQLGACKSYSTDLALTS